MATRTIHIVTDDIDDSEEDIQTVRIAYDGSSYEIDLGPANRDKFEQAIALFVGHARRQGGSPIPRATTTGRATTTTQATDTTYARRWHVAEGLPVSDRGRLKPEQMNAWAAAGAPRLD